MAESISHLNEDNMNEEYQKILDKLDYLESLCFSSNLTWEKVGRQKKPAFMNLIMIAIYGDLNFNYRHWSSELVNNIKVTMNSTMRYNKRKSPTNQDLLRLFLDKSENLVVEMSDLVSAVIKHEGGTKPYYNISHESLAKFIVSVLNDLLGSNSNVITTDLVQSIIDKNISITGRSSV